MADSLRKLLKLRRKEVPSQTQELAEFPAELHLDGHDTKCLYILKETEAMDGVAQSCDNYDSKTKSP